MKTYTLANGMKTKNQNLSETLAVMIAGGANDQAIQAMVDAANRDSWLTLRSSNRILPPTAMAIDAEKLRQHIRNRHG